MNVSNKEDITSLTSQSSASPLIRDAGQTYRKQLAAHLILASTFLERIAFYSISANVVFTLGPDTLLRWSVSNSSIASFMFSGKCYSFDTLSSNSYHFSQFSLQKNVQWMDERIKLDKSFAFTDIPILPSAFIILTFNPLEQILDPSVQQSLADHAQTQRGSTPSENLYKKLY